MGKGLIISLLVLQVTALAAGLWISRKARSAEREVITWLEACASQMLAEGREILRNPEGIHLDDGVANLKKSILPPAISKSAPASLIVRAGYLQVMLNVKAATRVGFRVFPEGVEGFGTRQITNGLWFVQKEI